VQAERVAVYARVSTAAQGEPKATSIEDQLLRTRAYATSRDWTVVAEYVDVGVSGELRLADRPEGRKLLTGDHDIVIFSDMSRFTRALRGSLNDLDDLEKRKKRVVFVKESVDGTTTSGRLFRNMLGSFSEYERDTIRHRNMSGRFRKASRGDWASGNPPYGYRWNKDDKRLEIVEGQAHYVRETFRLRGAGLSFYKVAKELGKNSHTVERWTQQAYYKDEPWTISLSPGEGQEAVTFSYECPALVDAEAWQKAQRVTSMHQGLVHPYGLLTRIFHRHPDGTLVPMRGQKYKEQDGGRRYRCKDGWGNNCPGFATTSNGRPQTSIGCDKVEGAVIEWIVNLVTDPDTYHKAVVEATEALEVLSHQTDEAALRGQIDATQKRIDRLITLYADGALEKDELYERLKGPKAQLAQYKELLALELEKVHTTEPLTPLSIDALFDMTIVEGGEDWAKDLEPERGSAQWLDEFLRATYLDPLPTWAIDELRLLAFALEIRVIIERGDDDKPSYTLDAINMSKNAVLEMDRRTCGNRCAPRNRARLDREM